MTITGGSGYFKLNEQVDKNPVARIQYDQEKRILLVWQWPHPHCIDVTSYYL